MIKQVFAAEQTKSVLLKYHQKKGYEIFKSFPLMLGDSTVMFTNSTITPFKKWFISPSVKPRNYALIQSCLRVGGASELVLVGFNPYYHTFFEMFGSGTFAISHIEAVQYLLELIDIFSLGRDRVYFTIPKEEPEFSKALKDNGIEQSHVFALSDNELFWQEWKFGKLGPVGRGLTVVYARTNIAQSVREMAEKPDEFVELLNLIHIYGQETNNGAIISATHPGFDLGVGIERLTAVLQGCNNYQIDTIRPLVEIVHDFLMSQGIKPDESETRACTDHLRAICMLISEGLSPSNKGQGYVLRKLIRRFLEFVWMAIGKIISVEVMAGSFADKFNQSSILGNIPSPMVADVIMKESDTFKQAIIRGRSIVRQRPKISPEVLRDTYGISEGLIHLVE